MNRKYESVRIGIFLVTGLLLVALYVIAFLCLDKDLKSIFDEGFFFLCFKPRASFTAFTQPLSLGNDVLTAFFPGMAHWDILSLRRFSFFLKLTGLAAMLSSSVFFVRKQRRPESRDSYLLLVLCILLMGLVVIPSVVVSLNDELLFCEMLVLSLCLTAVSLSNKWMEAVLACLVGVVSFFAMLCNAPGGGMLFLLSVLFLVFYPAIQWPDRIRAAIFAMAGIFLGVGIMHLWVISIPDCLGFVKEALALTSGSGAGAHHSLSKLMVSILLNIRDLIITVVSLSGITYVSRLAGRYFKKSWLEVVVGMFLFVIYYKWQVKPGIGFANIMTWLFLMTVIFYGERKPVPVRDWVLLLFLFLLPFCLSLGSNSGFVFKSKTVIVPWGILLFLMIEMTEKTKPYRSLILFLFVFTFIMISPGRYLVKCLSRDSYHFDQEAPVARMDLSRAQSDFYEEVHGVLEEYGFESRQDTLLGFCFNEMTVVAMDAVPYTNDQYPEEFLRHQGRLPRPSFLILGRWDEKVVSSFLESMDWRLSEDYDAVQLKSNPDPHSSYSKDSQSTLYCLKARKRQE